MTIFSTENLKKAYGDKLLFENVSVGMQEGDRIGILGRNGVGKTTFMRIVAAVEQADSGNSVFNNKVNFKYLEQLPTYTTSDTVLDTVLKGNQKLYDLLNEFHTLCRRIEENSTQELIDKLNKIENKNLPIFVYPLNTLGESEVSWIDFIDTMEDRVDINAININKYD